MAKKEKKTNQTGLALACWILGFLILLIVFLVKQDEIYSNLNTKRKETSLIDETINDNKLSTGREIEVNDDNNNISREMDVSLEKMSSNRNEDFSDDSIDNINILTINIKKVN